MTEEKDPLEGINVTRIEYSFGATVNIGNYENLRPEMKVVADLKEGDDPHAVKEQLAQFARKAVTKDYNDIKKAIKKSKEQKNKEEGRQ